MGKCLERPFVRCAVGQTLKKSRLQTAPKRQSPDQVKEAERAGARQNAPPHPEGIMRDAKTHEMNAEEKSRVAPGYAANA